MKAFKKIGIASLFMVLLTSCSTTRLTAQPPVAYINPVWAPPYTPGVRYYYLPDIEVYYDLANSDFVYLHDGRWQFSYGLPPLYSSYDLYNSYAIALNISVFEPWMHHHFYVSNYPRYYYRSLYPNVDYRTLRGFNENERKAIVWRQEDRERIEASRRTERVEERRESSRPARDSKYYGKNIGQPVKVEPQMRENNREDRKENRSERKQGRHH